MKACLEREVLTVKKIYKKMLFMNFTGSDLLVLLTFILQRDVCDEVTGIFVKQVSS